MEHLTNFVIGIFIGTGLIIPGVSGGVLAIALGVYDKLIKAFSGIFKDFKKNITFLIPIIFGIGLGTVLFGNIVLYLYTNYEVATKSAFLGLILGSLPIVFNKLKTGKNKYMFKPVPFLLATSVGVSLYIINGLYVVNESITTLNYSLGSTIKLFVAGLFYAVGKVIPGVSSSFMLMVLGIYEYVLSLLSNPLLVLNGELIHAVIFGLGFIIGAIVLSKIVVYLLEHYQYITYSAIIGFILGSILIIIPSYQMNTETLGSLMIFMMAFIISYTFARYENEKK